MTATRIATSRGPIPVTVGNFERLGWGGGAAYHGGVVGGVGSPGPGTYIPIMIT